MTSPSQLAAAAREGGLALLPDWPVFACAGRDALDLLGRLSTNDLAPLARAQAVSTLLLSPTGRLLFRVLLIPSHGELVALLEPGSETAFPAWVDRYTFGEDIRIQLASGLTAMLVVGEAVPRRVCSRTSGAPDGAAWARRDWGGIPAALGIGEAHALARVQAELGDLPLLDDDALLQLRAETGEPAAGREITNQRFPLEAGLAKEISFTKGCYTGQEVVARQDSYGKVVRRLVGLAFPEAPSTGDVLTSEGRDGCAVTTVAPEGVRTSQGELLWPALGFVSSLRATPRTEVTTAAGLQGHVVELPWPTER